MSDKNPYLSPSSDIKTDESVNYYYPSFFSLSGRIGRLRFLAYNFSFFLILMLLILVVIYLIDLFARDELYNGRIFFFNYLTEFFWFSLLITNVVIAKRRLNDINLSGWYSVIFIISFMAIYYNFWETFFLITGSLFLIFLSAIKANSKPNNYGTYQGENSIVIKFLGIVLPTIFGIIIIYFI